MQLNYLFCICLFPLALYAHDGDETPPTSEAKKAVKQPCTLAAMLFRILANMNLAFNKAGRFDDAALVQDLMKTFRP